MSMAPQPAERARRLRGWLLPTVLLAAFAPKCILCLVGYAGIGVALGLGGPELCGGSDGAVESLLVWLPMLGLATFSAVLFVRRRC
jgi:hypothetical protein